MWSIDSTAYRGAGNLREEKDGCEMSKMQLVVWFDALSVCSSASFCLFGRVGWLANFLAVLTDRMVGWLGAGLMHQSSVAWYRL